MKKVVAFDLETIANPAIVPLLPEVKPHKGLKDPVKIKADIEEKQKKQLLEMGMDPIANFICCAGWCDENGPGHILLINDNEKDLLLEFWDVLSRYDHFVTFNGRSFDLRCLLLHGMDYDLRPAVNIDKGRYNRGNHTDLRVALSGEGAFAKGTLDFYAKRFLGQQKTDDIDGQLVQHYWDMGLFDEVCEYCENDCILTYELFLKAQSAGLLE